MVGRRRTHAPDLGESKPERLTEEKEKYFDGRNRTNRFETLDDCLKPAQRPLGHCHVSILIEKEIAIGRVDRIQAMQDFEKPRSSELWCFNARSGQTITYSAFDHGDILQLSVQKTFSQNLIQTHSAVDRIRGVAYLVVSATNVRREALQTIG